VKEAFETMTQRLQAQVEQRYKLINQIIDEYAAKGITRLTGRQIFYQFVARGWVPNTKKDDYNVVLLALRTGRERGFIDWDAVEDRSRSVLTPTTWSSPSEIIASAARSYREDLWQNQKCRPEVWIEKQALAGLIEDVCDEYAVPLYTPRGFDSSSMAYEAGKRLQHQIENGGPRPIGSEDIRNRLEKYSHGHNIEVRRLGLTLQQVRRYRPPPNPVKEADTRTSWYRRQFRTNECWELDALDPVRLVQLVRNDITSLIDNAKWKAAQRRERRNRKTLEKLV
jgi:hypothetical protein